jgi:hypothetical protein
MIGAEWVVLLVRGMMAIECRPARFESLIHAAGNFEQLRSKLFPKFKI